jgi:HEPN domain-containing protein
MPRGESLYPDDWFRIAAQDLDRVARRLAEGDNEDAAFRLQQAVEKYLKGFLLARGWTLRRTHDVSTLLAQAVRYDRRLERFRALCRQVASYYIVERYPLFEEGPSITEVRKAYAKAKDLARDLQHPRSRGQRS